MSFIGYKTKDLFSRYYHLFKEGELEEMVSLVNIPHHIIKSGYDKDNWYLIVQKKWTL